MGCGSSRTDLGTSPGPVDVLEPADLAVEVNVDVLVSEFMVVGCGVKMLRTQYLVGFKDSSTYPVIDMLPSRAGPTIDGTLEYVAEHFPSIAPCLYNDAKVCKVCEKSCGYTMTSCNSCGESLATVVCSKSENVFAAFMLGVARAINGSPYTMSLRRLTDEVLIVDDLLSLTPCHFNAVPMKYYLPDWRYLLRAPTKGLELLDCLEREIWIAAAPFVSDEAFRSMMYKKEMTEKEIKASAICSFNFPPSQFQMHVQWMLPPLLPYQHFRAENRNHFLNGRAFPMKYVRKVLELDVPYDVQATTLIEDIIATYDAKGVVYETHWKEFYDHCLRSSMATQNWNPADFSHVVQDGKAFEFEVVDGKVKLGLEETNADPEKVQAKDKANLQNYGRPYDSHGKPVGTYILSPLQPKVGLGGFVNWVGMDISKGQL